MFTEYELSPGDERLGSPWTFGRLNRDIGTVNPIVVPQVARGEQLLQNPRPLPSEELLLEVTEYLERRRTLTSLLHATGPRYLPIRVNAAVRVWQRALDSRLIASSEQVKKEITAKIERFLHPLLGGPQGRGWAVGEDVVISDLLEFIKLDSRIGFVEELTAKADASDLSAHRPPVHQRQTERLGAARRTMNWCALHISTTSKWT